jgi:arginase
MSKENITIVSAESENGAGKRGASLGPQALFLEARQQGFDQMLRYKHIYTHTTNDEYDLEDATPWALNAVSVTQGLTDLAKKVKETLDLGEFPLIFSGDHSNGAGGVAGLRNAAKEDIGVIWVDAHADLHSPFTSPSGNMHGMPLGMALGLDHLPTVEAKNKLTEVTKDCWQKLKQLGEGEVPKLKAENLVFIGIRDLEKEEWDIVHHYNIKYFTPEEIKEKGMKTIMQEAFDYLNKVNHIYVSFDVDALDGKFVVGTGTPVPNGLSIQDGEDVFTACFNEPKVKAFEVTEINPLIGANNMEAKFVLEYLMKVL